MQNQLDTILLELRTRLWDNQDDAIYFDKWDFVHWGSAVVAVAMWPDRKFQRVIMKLGLIGSYSKIEEINLSNDEFSYSWIRGHRTDSRL